MEPEKPKAPEPAKESEEHMQIVNLDDYVKLVRRIRIPVDKFPNVNFIGRLVTLASSFSIYYSGLISACGVGSRRAPSPSPSSTNLVSIL